MPDKHYSKGVRMMSVVYDKNDSSLNELGSCLMKTSLKECIQELRVYLINTTVKECSVR